MTRSYVVTPRLSDAAVLTVSDAVGAAGAGNLQQSRPRLFWRSSTTTPYIQGDLGSARTVDTLVLGFINSQSSDTFRLRMASTVAKLTDGSAEYDSTTLSLWNGADLSAYLKSHRFFPFAGATLRYFRIDFDFTSNTNGYVQVGRLMLGARIEPSSAVIAGWSPSTEELVTETLDMGGEQAARVMGVRPSLSFTWGSLTYAEQAAMYALTRERGSSRDLAVDIHPDNTLYPMVHTVVGRVKQAIPFTQTFKTDATDDSHRFSLALVVTEMATAEMA